MDARCRVALISDTHGVLDEQTLVILREASVGLVLHAGDVGDVKRKSRATAAQILDALSSTLCCRVVAVAGNVDEGVTNLPEHTSVTVSGKKILLLHICNFPPKTVAAAQKIIDSEAPDIVVFGHSHVPGVLWHDNVLYVNPGSAGPRRFKLPRCVAFLSIGHLGELQVSFKAVTGDADDTRKLPEDMRSPPLDNKSAERESRQSPD